MPDIIKQLRRAVPHGILAAAAALSVSTGCERTGAKPHAESTRSAPAETEAAASTEAHAARSVSASVSAAEFTPAVPAVSTFRPSVQGFNFRNNFTGSPLPVSLGKIDNALGVPQHYGLCGGMSAAAADYFLAARDIPTQTDPPAKGADLYAYIYQRQIDSLGPSLGFAQVFATWMGLPDEGAGGTRTRSIAALPTLAGTLSMGRPAMLGLVLTSTKSRGKLWENHQVMAYDMVPATLPGHVGYDIRIYDPNFPDNDDAKIEVRPTLEGTMLSPLSQTRAGSPVVPIIGVRCTRTAPGRKDTPVRGIFVMPYEFKNPPSGLK